MNVLLCADGRLLLAGLGMRQITLRLGTQADMNSVSRYAHEHDIRAALRIHYRPFFEIIVYALPPREIQDLMGILSIFVSGLPPHPSVSPQCPKERARSRSCPPTLAVGQHGIIRSPPRDYRVHNHEDRKARRTLQQAILCWTPGTVSKAQSQSNGSTFQQQTAKDRQCGSLQYPSSTTKVDSASQHVPAEQQQHNYDTERDVVDDSDASSTTVDFLAVLRQIDPQRALDLERQYELEAIRSIDI